MRCRIGRFLSLLAAIALLVAIGPAAADPVALRVERLPDATSRLVIEWPTPVGIGIEEGAQRFRLHFSRSMEAELAPARAALQDRLAALVLESGGSSLRLDLLAGTRARLVQADERLVAIELAQAVAAPPPAPAESGAARLRTGRHADYGRIVLDWPTPVTYTLLRDGDLVSVGLAPPFPLDPARAVADLAPLLQAARATAEGIELIVAPGVGLRHFALEGNRVVIDLLDPPPGTPLPPVPPPEPEPERPAEPGTSPAAVPPPEPPEAPAWVPAPLPPVLDPEPLPTVAAAALDLVWPRPVAAAVFVRAGHLFAVFDAAPAEALDLPLALDPASGLGPGERLPVTGGGTALRYPLLRPQPVAVAREGGRWRIRLDPDAPPPIPVLPERLADPPRLLVPNATNSLELVDPEAGDRLGIATLIEPGRGLPERLRLVDLEFLPSAQGIVWRERADGLRSAPDAFGIELDRSGGLRLSPPDPTPGAPADPTPPAGVGLPDPALHAGATSRAAGALLAAAGGHPARGRALRVGPPLALAGHDPPAGVDPFTHRRALERAAATAGGEARELARLELARFLLGQGLATESRAVAMAIEAPADDAAVAPLRRAREAIEGATALLLGRPAAARRWLDSAGLDDAPEAALWRALVHAAEGDRPAAEREIGPGHAALAGYPLRLQGRLAPQIARILIDAGAADAAFTLLDRLAGLPLRPDERARLEFERGVALQRDGAFAEAERVWTLLVRGGHEETAIRAYHARTMLAVKRGALAATDAAQALAAELPFWRNHPDEMAMLDDLARLQAQIGESPSALAHWRRAMTLGPESERATAIAGRMRAHLLAVLHADNEHGPGPLATLSLFHAYAELVPTGAAGDRALRHLADRLADQGMVEPAAELLERLVGFRLAGAAKTEAGAALAALRLRAGDPGAALTTLITSATGAALEPGLAALRERLAAEAEIAQGRLDSALTRLGADTSRAADLLRLEVHWQRRDWPRAALVAERLLPEDATAAGALDRQDAAVLVRLALARHAAGEREALGALGARFGDEALLPPFRAVFRMATMPEPPRAGFSALLAAADAASASARDLLATGPH
jgi:hypothetical protein